MRMLGPSSEAEMVAIFLRGEIDAARYAPTIAAILACEQLSRQIIDAPDLNNPLENVRRRAILGAFRGFGQDRAIFEGFPADVRWERASVRRDELARVRYIDYDYWVALSGGSRLAPDAAQTIRAGQTIFRVPNDGIWAVAAVWQAGVSFPELILVGTREGEPLVLLEGHGRLTGYFLADTAVPPELVVLVGWSPEMPRWTLY